MLPAALPGAEATTPTLSSNAIDLRNDGTWAATLTLTFNTNVKVHTSEADTLNDITAEGAKGSSMQISGATVKIFFLPPAEETMRAADHDIDVSITSTAIRSTDTSTAYGGVTNSRATTTQDSVGPKVASAALDRDGGVLYIVTDESIAYGDYNVASANGGDARVQQIAGVGYVLQYGTSFENVTKYHVRDGATASGGVTMASSNNPSVHRTPAHEIRFTLSSSQLSTVTGYTSPHLHMDAGALTGIGSQYQLDNAAVSRAENAAIAKAINYIPRATAAELTVATRALSVTFDESVTKSSGTFYIRNSATGAYAASTDVAGTLSTVSGTAGSATLSASDVTKVQGMATPHLHVNAGAVTDGGGADNLKKAVALTVTSPGPALSGATLDETTRTLTLTMDRTAKSGDADVTQSNILVRDGAGTSGGTALTGSTVSSTGNSATVTLTLTPSQVATVTGYAAPHVYLKAGAVKNTSDQANVLSATSVALGIYPALESAVVDLNNFSTGSGQNTSYYAGKLALKFNVDVGVSTSDADTLPKITVREADNSPTLTLDTNASVITSTATVEIGLSNAQKEAVRAMSGNLEVLIGASAFKSDTGSLALPAVGDGALSIPGASVTPDTTRPAITSVSLDGESGLLTLNFDELVQADPADINLSHMQLYYPQRGNFHLGDLLAGYAALSTPCVPAPCPQGGSAVTSSGDSTAVTVQLSEEHRKRAIALIDPQYWIQHQESIKDTSGNFTPSAVFGGTSYTPDTNAPTLVTSSADRPALDEGTGILTLTFSESVKDGSNVDLTKIFIAGSTTASGGTALSVLGDASEVTSTSDTDSTITVELREPARLAAIGHTTPYVYFASGAVVDLSNQTLAASTAAAEITDTADNDPPTVESAALDEGTGILTITFDETVDVSSASSNGASFELREGASATDNLASEVVLSDGEIQSGQSDGLTFKFELDEDSRRDAISLSNPYLYVAAGAITDIVTPTANAIAANTDGTVIDDTDDDDGPDVEAVALNEGTGVLTITFDEEVDVSSANANGASFELREGASATDNLTSEVVLSDDEIRQGQSDGLTFVFELDEDSRQGAISLALPHLYVADGAINDTIAANSIALNAAGTAADITRDTVKPEIASAALSEETGLLVITFDETVDVSSAMAASFQIRDGSGSASGSAGEIVLSASEVQQGQTDGTALNFELSEASRRGAIDLADPYLYVSAGAVNDAVTMANSGIAPNGIDAASADIVETADTTAPSLSSAALDEETGILTLTFDESVKDGQGVELGRIFIGDGAFSSGGEPLTGSTVTSSDATTDAAVTIDLTEILRKSAIGYADPHVRLAEGAVRDVSDLDISASGSSTIADTPDTTPPTISATDGPILHEPAGVLTVVFSESVQDGDDVDLTKIFVNDGPFTSGGTALTSSSGTSTMRSTEDTDPEILVTLHETLRLAVIAYTTPHLRFDLGAVKDLSGQAIVASTSSTAIGEVTDLTPPVVSSAALNEETGILTITFNESIDVSTADGAKFSLREGAGAAAGSAGELVLSNAQARQGQPDGTAFVFELSEASRLAAINLGDPRLYVSEGAIEDGSLNRIAANTAGIDVSQTLDTTDPALLASGLGRPALDEATGVLTLTFGESVKETADLAKIRIRDGPGTGGTPLTGSEITSAHIDAVVAVDLSEALRKEAIGYADPHVVLESGAVVDLSDRGVAASAAQISDRPDLIAPSLLSAALDEATGILTLEFDESVKDGQTDLAKIRLNDGRFNAGGTALTGSAVSSTQDTDSFVTVQLTETLRQIAIAYATPHVRLESGAVVDLSDQGVAASADSAAVSDAPDPSVLPTIRSAEVVSAHTVRVSFNLPLTGAGPAGSWSVGDNAAVSVRVPTERVGALIYVGDDMGQIPEVLSGDLVSVGGGYYRVTTADISARAVFYAYVAFQNPVEAGQSISYSQPSDPSDVADFDGRDLAAQSVQISARSAYTPVETAAVSASLVRDGMAYSGEARKVVNYDPSYEYSVPAVTRFHSLWGAEDVATYTVDGDELVRALFSGSWETVRYDPRTDTAHLSGRVGSPETAPAAVNLRGSVGTFAVAASASDDGIQIVNITDPYAPRQASYVADNRSPAYGCAFPTVHASLLLHCVNLAGTPGLSPLTELDGAKSVDIAQIGDRTYAVVAGKVDNGVQMIDITDPVNPQTADSADDTDWAAGIHPLVSPNDLAVFSSGGKTYAAVAAEYGGSGTLGAVTVLDISDPALIRPASLIEAGAQDGDGREYDSVEAPVSIDTFESGGSAYAIVSAYDAGFDSAVQIIDLSDPAAPKRASSITGQMLDRDGRAFADFAIETPGQVRAFSASGVPHALLAYSDTLQIVNLADPYAPRSAGAVTGGPGPFSGLLDVKGVDVVQAGGRVLAAATAGSGDGLFLIDISDPASPQRLAYVRDGQTDPAGARVALAAPLGVSLSVIDGRLYASVASSQDRAVSPGQGGALALFDLTEPAGLGSARTVTIGALAPLTGPVSPLGLHWEAAMRAAAADLNAELEAQGADWRASLDVRDTEGRPAEALEQLVSLDMLGVKAVVGPATSAGLAQVKQYAEDRGITLVSYGSTAPSLPEDNRDFGAGIWATVPPGAHSLAEADGIFRTAPPDALAGSFAAEQLAKAGKTHVTIIFRDDPWERALAEQVRDEFAVGSRTAALVPHESPVADPAALAAAMAAAHKTGSSAVLTLEFSADAVTVMSAAIGASSAPSASPAAQALGTSQWFGMVALDNTLSHALSERGVELLRLSASGTSTLETILDRDRIRAVAAQLASSSPSPEAAPFRAAFSATSGLSASGPISAEDIIAQSERIIDFVSQTRYTLIEEVPNREHPSFARVTGAVSSMLDDRHEEFGVHTYAAYDAVRLLGRAVAQSGSLGAEQLRAAVPAAADGYRGLAGDGTLDPNGDLASAQFELSQVRGGQAVKIPHYELPLTISRFEVSSRHASGLASDGTAVDVSFESAEPFSFESLKINGRDAFVSASSSTGVSAEWAARGSDADGPLQIALGVTVDGIRATLGARHLTGPNVLVDNTPPQLEQISLVGQRALALFYSEPVETSASDYASFSYGSSSAPAASSVRGSGTASVLAMLGPSDDPMEPGMRISFSVSGVADRAGNALSNAGAQSLVPADTRGGTVVLRDTARDGRAELILPPDSLVRTVVAPQPVALDASLLPSPAPADARVASAGESTAEFASGLTVRIGSVTVVLPAGLQAGGLPADRTLRMSAASSAVPSEDYVADSRLDSSRYATLVEVGDPAGRVELSLPARIEFGSLEDLVFVVSGGRTLAVQECSGLTGSSTLAEVAAHLASLDGSDRTDAGSCFVRQDSAVWTNHFSAWGTGSVLQRGGSECDDCTPPTLGLDSYGTRLVDGGFSYNGLSSDVAYFFTPYPLIESEVGRQNTVALKIYENEGPGNVEHVSLAFGLRSGEVISESRAVINYDISFDGTGAVSVIDPDGAIDTDTLSASHEIVECSAGSSLECLSVTITHMFRAPLEFDIVGTDVWDRERNSWQNYYNHGIRVSGEPLDPQPGVQVNGMVLYPVSSGTDIMMDAGGHLFKMSPQGQYVPLSNQSRLYHDIDESMYLYDGVPKQGYDRSDPQFRDHLYAQVLAAQKILDSMMPPAEAGEPAHAPAEPDREADEQRLREAVLAEQARAALLFEELFGYQRINGQN